MCYGNGQGECKPIACVVPVVKMAPYRFVLQIRIFVYIYHAPAIFFTKKYIQPTVVILQKKKEEKWQCWSSKRLLKHASGKAYQ